MTKTITTTFEALERNKHASVTDYCRFLMKINAERYQDMAVEVYRGDMMCLVVKSVKEGAALYPNPAKARFELYRPDKHKPKGST